MVTSFPFIFPRSVEFNRWPGTWHLDIYFLVWDSKVTTQYPFVSPLDTPEWRRAAITRPAPIIHTHTHSYTHPHLLTQCDWVAKLEMQRLVRYGLERIGEQAWYIEKSVCMCMCMRACVCACMPVESVVVHVWGRVCATTATSCVFVGCVSNAKWWEKKDFISIIWMLTFHSGQS